MRYKTDWKTLVSYFGYGFVDEIEQYKHIVKVWAYNDMQPRTISGLGDFRKNNVNNDKLDKLFDELAKKLKYFVVEDKSINDEKAFDKWHKKICEWFVKSFNKITAGKCFITCGKAQKIINVSLKYIYCLKGAEDYVDKFRHCHMILDRYTYSDGFYKKEVLPWINESKDKSDRLKTSGLTAWSNLEYEDYIDIQKNIREFMEHTTKYVDSEGKQLTPFQAEFYIFSKYKDKLMK